MIRSIGIASGKGGVGKTTVTINLATALMEFNRNVIALDADVKMSSLGIQLGMYYFPFTLNDVLNKRSNVLDTIYIHPSGLRIIPTSLAIEKIGIGGLKDVLNNKLLDDNIILVDSPPGLETNALSVLKSCKEIIVVTTPEIPALTDVIKTIDAAGKCGVKMLGVVVNRYKKSVKEQLSIKEIESGCGLPVIGIIPEDRSIPRSVFKKGPAVKLYPYSPLSISFKKIAAGLLDIEYHEPKFLFLKRVLRRER